MRRLALHWWIFLALLLGILYGILLPGYSSWVDWMGVVFLRALKMVVVPLILTTIIYGVASIGSESNLGRIGLKTFSFYLITTLIAVSTGVILMNLFQPGTGSTLDLMANVQKPSVQESSIREILIGIIPDNIFQSFAQTNSLQIILFSILAGYFITKLKKEQNEFLTQFFQSASELMMKITLFVIRFAPLGIFGIVTQQIAAQKDVWELFSRLGFYMILIIAGLGIQTLIYLPLSLALFRINPVKHYKSVSSVLITAFSTSSSNATLPLTLNTIEQKCGVSRKICSFTLPLGATINMNGTALYEIAAALFIAQVYGIHLSFSEQLIMVFTAMLAAVGAAGIPMAGMVTMTIVLTAAGLPLEGIGLVLAVDRPLDMFRTLVNVLGDTCGAVVVAKSEGEKLNYQ